MKLGLVIDLDVCVGCHACSVACKQWNTSGTTGALTDYNPYGKDPSGVWFNRVRQYEVGDFPHNKTVNFPMSCMHCEVAACVTVCPTGASYKRAEDGIVLVDQDKCMGCNYCSWACPYGARELDAVDGTMKKCTLCIDRIYDTALSPEDRQPACVVTCPAHARYFGDFADENSKVSQLVSERAGYQLMPEMGYQPTNHYLPPRQRKPIATDDVQQSLLNTVKTWINKAIIR
ncbi:4Fe-4S dicluster domain-containing protein [Beggiatoa leptomitoformis]|uniref:4Fe-4S dicluster domain-containing protein n=1 Tax=Beggiatoa leptomitoformis TaxID=288004 RepID=A0A2N9YGY7_9GAMM|nr:4Fe-4S dicluster domain-containing protein [Beggiatoa leptomitoformis]ALG67939.1 4Fe-4S dicluster domain-containing protein [Beggiatoa leptomitoformis]AUI69788.1 4Fe-4S dicluster domain-containing protein [Beggiatoa leptomitoformis]